jgi:hypothetical protein
MTFPIAALAVVPAMRAAVPIVHVHARARIIEVVVPAEIAWPIAAITGAISTVAASVTAVIGIAVAVTVGHAVSDANIRIAVAVDACRSGEAEANEKAGKA